MSRPMLDPLLNLPLDAVPQRSPFELQLIVAPLYPDWLRRNHTKIDMGTEDARNEYSLYTVKIDEKGYRQLWRIVMASTAEGTSFGVALCLWRDDLPQTRKVLVWDVVDGGDFLVPEARDQKARELMGRIPSILVAGDTDSTVVYGHHLVELEIL